LKLDLVADTNIIFSALIKSGKIRKIILTQGTIKLHIPEELQEELHNHTKKLKRYLNLPEEGIHDLINEFIKEVAKPHKKDEYKNLLPEAEKLIRKVDPTDAPFVALAMHLEMPLWTGDKGVLRLSARTKFKHYVALDTYAVEMLLEGKSWNEVEKYLEEKYGGED